uniref:Uncharacterized protein n=1 Tax=Timema monikensis TaxID=170555 RepID=A0A7R9EKM8_9NEOP|nr:unnamed protein product [Timema monikensis]
MLLDIYRRKKEKYESALRLDKRESWERYVQEELINNAWGIPFQIVTGKARPRAVISTLKTKGGDMTSCWEESARLLFETLLPDDNVEDDEENETARMNMLRNYDNKTETDLIKLEEIIRLSLAGFLIITRTLVVEVNRAGILLEADSSLMGCLISWECVVLG